MRPKITRQNIKTLLETKFIKVFDLQYAGGRHYYNATRRSADDLVAVKSTEEFQNMLPGLGSPLESIQRGAQAPAES